MTRKTAGQTRDIGDGTGTGRKRQSRTRREFGRRTKGRSTTAAKTAMEMTTTVDQVAEQAEEVVAVTIATRKVASTVGVPLRIALEGAIQSSKSWFPWRRIGGNLPYECSWQQLKDFMREGWFLDRGSG